LSRCQNHWPRCIFFAHTRLISEEIGGVVFILVAITEVIDRVKPVEKINRAAEKLIKQFAKDANRKGSK
jgi:uncharacterized protein YabN with tetrapyrrole methylase and pyrophosphatase domain